MDTVKPPAPNPCGTCPYRQDVPSGVWEEEEYEKLPPYDGETFEQPIGVFLCHQQDGRACAGWCGVHDMHDALAIRIASSEGRIPDDDLDAFLDYETSTSLWASGAEAAEHGLAEIETPSPKAMKKIDTLTRRQEAREGTDDG